MPGFVKTKKDEKTWSKSKKIAAKRSGGVNKMSDKDYALANYLFHRMKGGNNK